MSYEKNYQANAQKFVVKKISEETPDVCISNEIINLGNENPLLVTSTTVSKNGTVLSKIQLPFENKNSILECIELAYTLAGYKVDILPNEAETTTAKEHIDTSKDNTDVHDEDLVQLPIQEVNTDEPSNIKSEVTDVSANVSGDIETPTTTNADSVDSPAPEIPDVSESEKEVKEMSHDEAGKVKFTLKAGMSSAKICEQMAGRSISEIYVTNPSFIRMLAKSNPAKSSWTAECVTAAQMFLRKS